MDVADDELLDVVVALLLLVSSSSSLPPDGRCSVLDDSLEELDSVVEVPVELELVVTWLLLL